MPEHDAELVKLFKQWRASGVPIEQFCQDPAQLQALKKFIKESAKSLRSKGDFPPAASIPTPGGDTPHAPVTIEIDGYRLIREISRGGQAVVFEGVFLKTGRKVAIKVMRDGPLATEASRARFSREIQILAALSHPNIVNVLDRGKTRDGSEFFVMEYIEGESLDAVLWKRPASGGAANLNDPAKPLLLFLKICDAVNAAHLRGVVHRDLKPSNIRVDERGEPHVLDFGLARTAFHVHAGDGGEPVTQAGHFLGSLPWASPEQAEGAQDKIDSRTDVYSLGVILYQLVTLGHFPYEVAGSMRDILNNIMTTVPSPPSALLAAKKTKQQQRQVKRARQYQEMFNPIMDAIVLRALAKRREDRYQNAGDFARDIEAYLAGRVTVAGGPSAGRGIPWKWIGAGIGVAAAVAVVATVTLFVRRRGEPPPSHPLAYVPPENVPTTSMAPKPATSVPEIAPPATLAAAPEPPPRATAPAPPPTVAAGAPLPATLASVPASALIAEAPPAPLHAQEDAVASMKFYRIQAFKASDRGDLPEAILYFAAAAKSAQEAHAKSEADELVFAGDISALLALQGIPGFNMPMRGTKFAGIRFSPDSKYVACVGMSGGNTGLDATQIFSLDKQAPVGALLKMGAGKMLGGAFSLDGSQLATISGRGTDGNLLRMWNWQSGNLAAPIVRLNSEPVSIVDSPGGREFVVLCRAGEIVVADGRGNVTRSWPCSPQTTDGGAFANLLFSPDGKTLFTTLTNTPEVWDFETGRLKYRLSDASTIEFAPDSRTIATGSSRGIDLRNAQSGKVLNSATLSIARAKGGDSASVNQLHFSEDAKLLLSTYSDDPTLRLWDLNQQALAATPPISHPNRDMVFDAIFIDAGKKILSDSMDGARLWNAATGEPIAPLIQTPGTGIVSSHDGRWKAFNCPNNTNTRVVDFKTLLNPRRFPVSDLATIGEVMSARTVDPAKGLMPLSVAEIAARLKTLGAAYPDISFDAHLGSLNTSGGAP